MSDPVVPDPMEWIRALHVMVRTDYDEGIWGESCATCHLPWPCHAVQVLEALDAANAENGRLAEERDALVAETHVLADARDDAEVEAMQRGYSSVDRVAYDELRAERDALRLALAETEERLREALDVLRSTPRWIGTKPSSEFGRADAARTLSDVRSLLSRTENQERTRS